MAEASINESLDQQVDTESTPTVRPSSRRKPKLSTLALTDVAGVLAALSVWAAADVWHQATQLPLATLVAIGDGIFVGYLMNALIHEWGHYLGARLSGAATTFLKLDGFSLFRFKFDFTTNTARQFNWMSIGGNIAHWAVVAGLVLALPLNTPGQIAIVAAAFGFAMSATVFELPVIRAVYGGADPELTLKARATDETFTRGRWISIVSGIALFTVLS